MSSIYLKATTFLHRGPCFEDFRDDIPFIVCNRGLFDCIAPRFDLTVPKDRAAFILANACTFHLTRAVTVEVDSTEDFASATTLLRKLTQVVSLTLRYYLRDYDVSVHPIIAEIKRFALTLIKLDVTPHLHDSAIDELASSLPELHNVQELSVPNLTPSMCTAIAAGPGARLHELSVRALRCEPADLDVLVAGCPNIWALKLGSCRFDSVLSASRVPYLQALTAMIINSPLETDMFAGFSNMERLTRLDIELVDLNLDFSNSIATIIAATVGPQLVALSLDAWLTSHAFATICCASSFPQLEILSLRFARKSIITADITVSLSPSLRQLTLSYFQLARRTLTQLLTNKPNLKDIEFCELTLSHRRGRFNSSDGNDDDATPTQAEQVEDDWFGQLVKSPVQKLTVSRTNLAASMDPRVVLLAPTLTEVSLSIGADWPAVPRDEFFGSMFSNCVLLERIMVKINVSRLSTKLIPAFDAKVAFAGLRNNQRLRHLELGCDISSPVRLVEELLAMRSNKLEILILRKAEQSTLKLLRQRFPQVS